MEAARAARSCDCFPFQEEGENVPCLPRNRATEIPHGPQMLPSPKAGQAAAIPHPTPALLSCSCLSKSQANSTVLREEKRGGQMHPGFAFPPSLRGHKRELPRGCHRSQQALGHLPFLHTGRSGLHLKSGPHVLVREPCKVYPA